MDAGMPTDRACGHPVVFDAPAAPCPHCLLDWAARKFTPAAELPLPERIGNYKIVALLGSGGMGDVYLAEQPVTKRQVALKTLRHGELVDEAVLKRFRDEIEILAQLRHPNIVTIYDGSGLHEEPPFFVMQWIDGGSLDSPALREKFREPLRAAALMLTVAEAVQSAHESLVLHRDLKPANILIDTKDRPHVSDFGVAKLLDGEEPQATATIVGSLGFMPPEQAGAIAQPVTTASDVYGLGATLYFLLTGRAPYEAADLLSLLVCFNAGPPTRPKQLAPGIGDDLQRVCLAALEHDPARRYRTAAAFGEDLRRVLEGRPSEPPNEPPVTPWRRLHCGARRQPHVVFGLAMLVLFAWAMYAMTVQSEEALRSAVLRTNAALAASRARTVLELLKQDEQTVQHAASDPVVQDYLTRATITNPAPRLAELAPGFDTVFVVDLEGAVCARWPGAAVQYYARRFKFRDYFKGAIALRGQGVHVSQAFHSEFDDDNLKFAISAPVRAADGKLLGIFVAARATAQTYRDVHFDDSFSSGQITAVLGPREPPKHATADDTPQKSLQFSVVMHSELKAAGSEYRVERGLSDRLQRRFPQSKPGAQLEQSDVSPELSENFHDPLMPGRWLAAIAPIGHTGYAVVCQTDYTTKGYPNLSTILPQVGLPVWLLLNFALLTRKILARRPR